MSDIVDIGAECFVDTDIHVISYRGENYYKACDAFVRDRPDGGQSFCVKRVDHPGNIHEAYDGYVREEIVSDRFQRYLTGEPAVPNLTGSKGMQAAIEQIKPGVEEGMAEVDLAGRPEPPEGTSYLYTAFEIQLANLLNRHSKEKASGTPDHILAEYLIDCLKTWDKYVGRRAAWRGEHTELPALYEIQNGVRTVPLVVYSGKLHIRNEIGEAKIKITPGEQLAQPFGQIEAVIAKFEDPPGE
jgi:hypothetical protein